MKRFAVLLLAMVCLTGCKEADQALDEAMGLRAKLMGSGGCSFDARITADYGDKVSEFKMSCQTDLEGDLTFTVLEPEVIQGVSGHISSAGGALTFDDQAVAFPLLADDQLSPVIAPWIFVKTLQGGNVKSCGKDGDLIRVSIDDSYQEDALRLDIWLEDGAPVRGEVLYRDKRILTLEIENFEMV